MVRQDGGDLDEIVQGHAGGLELGFEILPGEPALLGDIVGNSAVHPLADLAADIERAGRAGDLDRLRVGGDGRRRVGGVEIAALHGALLRLSAPKRGSAGSYTRPLAQATCAAGLQALRRARSAIKIFGLVSSRASHLVMCCGTRKTMELTMTPRLNPFAAAPGPMQSWLDFGKGLQRGSLEDGLMELVKIRASQINGCAFCLHMHTADARKRRRDRGAPLPARRLARIAALQRARARRAGLDRGADAALRDAAPDDVYRGAQGAVHRGGAGEADPADRRDQRLEPDSGRLPRRPSGRERRAA